MRALLVLTAATLAVIGCDSRTSKPLAQSPAPHVDSVIPRAEELRRFREGIATPPTELRGGARSADALVQRFARALERSDTAELRNMLLDRAEFAYVYYESSPLSRPPYDLSPGLMWFQMTGNSAKGLGHALVDRVGRGRPLHVVSFKCAPPVPQGDARFHGGCTVRRVQAPGDTVDESLFGAILEYRGHFKFVSYANKL